MKKGLSIFLVCVFCFFSVNAQSQDEKASKKGFLKTWGVGVDAGLYGFGGFVSTSLTPRIKLRVGYDMLTYTYNDAIDMTVPIVLPTGVTIPSGYDIPTELTGELSDTKIDFPNFKVMADLYPVKGGIFCITAGFFVGNNSISTKGMVNNYSTFATYGLNPEIEFGDVIIQPNKDGSFDAKVVMGNKFKPYVGLGLGRTIPNSHFGFKFDLGVVFQGEYVIESSNMKGTLSTGSLADEVDLPFSEKWLDYWPMMNFSLTYRF